MYPQEKSLLIQQLLEKYVPDVSIPLTHSDPYTLLIAVVLSAQCTDKRVNAITPQLFSLASTPEMMATVDPTAIEAIIAPCGLARTKSRAIFLLSQQLCSQHKGIVPANWEALEALPGVGHKTASVVMSQAFGIPAFPVDTHIHRCAKRWGLSDGSSVKRTEADLKKLFPEEMWNKLHLQIIYFARSYCRARGHITSSCPICSRLP